MADPAPDTEFKPDLEAHARLSHTVLEMLLGATHHIVAVIPATAGIAATLNRARDMLDRAGGLLVDRGAVEAEQQKAKDQAEIDLTGSAQSNPLAPDGSMQAPGTQPLSDHVPGSQFEPQPDHG